MLVAILLKQFLFFLAFLSYAFENFIDSAHELSFFFSYFLLPTLEVLFDCCPVHCFAFAVEGSTGAFAVLALKRGALTVM